VIPFPADVGVAIVAHNSRDKLGHTLASLEAAGCPRTRILIVDVASDDGTREWILREHPEIRIERLDRNDGPNPGRNFGIRQAAHPYVFLMDADAIVRPDTMHRLRTAMAADPRIKIGSPVVVHADAPSTIQYAGGHLHFMCEAINLWMNRSLSERGAAPADVGVASANGLLLDRQAAIDVGLFDERYFMGKDDGDFTHRVRLAGHRILELPEALVLHHSRPRSTWLFYYQIRNRWHFMLKNYQWRTLLFILPCLMIHEPLQLVVLHAKGHGRTYWKSVAGLFALLPSLRNDRAFIRDIRAVPDSALLRADSLIIRDDLSSSAIVRAGKNAYEGFLRGYWWLLTRTVLAK